MVSVVGPIFSYQDSRAGSLAGLAPAILGEGRTNTADADSARRVVFVMRIGGCGRRGQKRELGWAPGQAVQHRHTYYGWCD